MVMLIIWARSRTIGPYPLLLILVLALACRAWTQEADVLRPGIETAASFVSEGRDIAFRRLPSTAGISQTRVSQITQDDDGFLWLGTQSGLNRYDGYKCKVFKHDRTRPGSLGGVFLYSLFKDSSGRLWAGSDQYLDRYDPVNERFERIRISAAEGQKPVNFGVINQGGGGQLWFPTSDGLYGFDPGAGRSVHYQHADNDPSSLSQQDLQTVEPDGSGKLWIGMRLGLDLFDPVAGKVIQRIRFGDVGLGVWVHEDRSHVFWLMDGNGRLGILDRHSNRLTRFDFRSATGTSSAADVQVLTMLEDRDGTMWFGTANRGLLKYDRARNRFIGYTTHPGDDESLPDNRVITLFQDREGNIWAGLHQTAPVFFSPSPQTFHKFTYQPGNPNSLGSALVSVIHEDPDGALWFGADRLVKRLNRKTGKYSVFTGVSGHEVLSIVEQGPDILWMGTGGLGLKRYDRRTGKIKTYLNSNSPTSLCSNFVEKMIMDRKGRLWQAAWGGLCYLDPATGRFTRFNAPSANRTYHAIAEDREGAIWLGSNLGLQRFDPETGSVTAFVHSDDPGSVNDNRVNSIYPAQDGTLWIGAQNGLDRYDPVGKRFEHFNEKDGLGGNVVACVMEDTSHRLWMSTNAGISSFAPNQRVFRNYSTADGLPGPDLTGWGACFESPSGEMFFGGFSGATAFHPDRVSAPAYAPPVALTGFRLFGLPVDPGGRSPLARSVTRSNHITLSHDQNIFSIDFAALSFVNPAANRYRYRLENLQPEWVQATSDQRQASYTTLPAGDYTFRVQGATSHGPWSEPGAVLRISVLPAWWATWWFRTLAGLGVAAALFGIYFMRMRALSARMQSRLREQQREEERLRANQRELALIINTIPAMAWSASADGDADFVNHHYLEFTGLTLEEALGSGWTATLHPEDLPRFAEYWRVLMSSGSVGETEARMRRRDGAYRWVLFRVSPLHDQSGKVVKWYGTNADIHARREAEEALRSSERDLSLIIETIPGLVWCASPDGELNYVNRRLLAYTASSLADWANGGWITFVHPNDRERVSHAWSRALSTGQLDDLQCRLRRSDGEHRWFQVFGQPARDAQGAAIRWYGLLLDIDDRKRIEEALHHTEQRLTRATQTATVGEFAAAIAHEINQPLSAVVTNAHACLRWLSANPPGLAKAREAADRIVRDGRDAGEVVRRIRALFRRADIEHVALDVNEIVREVLHLTGKDAANRQVRVRTELAQRLPLVIGDRIQLQQVVFNLIMNGIEAMDSVPDGQRELLVRSTQPSRDLVLVQVEDSGTGLADTEKPFEAFFTTKNTGMGMGLAICRSIVTAHHGRLWAEGRDGAGATFSFTLPVHPAAS